MKHMKTRKMKVCKLYFLFDISDFYWLLPSWVQFLFHLYWYLDVDIEHTSHDTDEVYNHIGSSSPVRRDDTFLDNDKGNAASDEIELEIITQNDEDDVCKDREGADGIKSIDGTECIKDKSSPKSSNEDLES